MTFVGLGLEVRGRFFWETGHRRGDGSNSLISPSWNLVNMELVKVSLVTMSFMRVQMFRHMASRETNATPYRNHESECILSFKHAWQVAFSYFVALNMTRSILR